MNNLPKIATAKRVIAGFLNLMLGQKTTVVWGQKTQCFANGVVHLPHPKLGDAQETAILLRKAVHEAGHRMHTDFTAFAGMTGGVKGLMNALEDPRIEYLQTQKYKGGALILNQGFEELFLRYEQSLDPNAPEHKARLVVLNVLIKGSRSLAVHSGYLAPADRVVANGDQVLGINGVQAVDHAVAALGHCQNTSDVVALAEWLYSELQPSKPAHQSPSPAQPDCEPDGEKGADQTGQPDCESQGAQGETQPGQSEVPADAAQPGAPPSNSQASDPTDGAAGKSESTGAAETEEDANDAQPEGNAASAAGEAETGVPSVSPEGDGQKESAAASDQDASQPPDQSGSSGTEDGETLPSEQPLSVENPESPKAHNQENPASQPSPQGAPGEAGGAAKGHAQGPGAPAELDFNSAEDFDLGQMLQEAYEAKYGESDVDDPSLGKEPHKTEPDEKFTQLLASSFDRSAQDDQSLEKALADLENELAASTAGEVDESENEHDVLLGPGTGNARGQAQALEGNSALVGVASRLVRLFTKELQDKRRRNVKLQPAGGRVASQQAWRLKALGDTRIFSTRASVCGIDAAVTILLDRSGSMSDCIVDAATAALACAQAFERISRVKTSIELFPGLTGGEVSVTLQAYGQSARQIAHRVTEIAAGGGTPLAQALVDVVPKLLVQRVKKRMVLLITDGSPNDADGVRKRIEEARNAGVEFLGIGIGEDGKAIEGLVPYSVVVNGASELPDAFEALFRSNCASALTAYGAPLRLRARGLSAALPMERAAESLCFCWTEGIN